MSAGRRVGPGASGGPTVEVATIAHTCSDGKPGHPIEHARVVHRMCNYSAFNGYHYTPSDWSLVECTVPGCGTSWRTKAGYVRELHDS